MALPPEPKDRVLDDVERINLDQIEMLNQRGGRTLSIVDLIGAGTVSEEMAAFALAAMSGGASLLTAARPGGAGKTTLMAALLGFLPSGERLRTVGLGASRVPRGHPDHGRECLVAHEIGNGPYFGYLWGRDARAFFEATRRNVRVASNLHADTLEELTDELCSPSLGICPQDVARVGLVMFLGASPGPEGVRRRVLNFYAGANGGRELLWEWDPASDRYRWCGPGAGPPGLLPPQALSYTRALEFVHSLVERNESDFASVRREVRTLFNGKAGASS